MIISVRTVCTGKLPFNPRVPFAFEPVEPKMFAKWKAPQSEVV